jgi:putative DNA primase/helicase
MWDGGLLGNERRTVDSVRIENPRGTVSISTQPAVMDAYRRNNGSLSRGSGWFSRFLFGFPDSTQGTRQFREPGPMPNLEAFHKRCRELADVPLTYDDPESPTPKLNPPTVPMSPEGAAAWIAFYNEVETELGPGGEVSDAKDVASKAAENVARLAAQFHVFEHGPAGSIGADHVEAAARIVTWHLYEAQRYFTAAAPTQAVTNAAKLEAWLVRRIKATGELQTKTTLIQKEGPNAVRHKPELLAALDELKRRGRVRTVRDGRADLVEVNPAVVGGA